MRNEAAARVLRHPRSSRDYAVHIIGAPRTPLRDFYHALLRLSWPATIAVVIGGYLVINAAFALVYFEVGGVSGARSGSVADAFYFSVETMGTIGYGAMYPQSEAANLVMVVESAASLVLTALATGLVFARFSRPTASLLFTHQASIAPMNGVPTLSFRVGNRRGNRIVQATVRVSLVRTERTLEGKVFYRMLDLKLSRDHILALSRSWNVLHAIEGDSPLVGETAETLAEKEVELLVAVAGTDDIWMQTVHGSHRYLHHEIAWGMRHVDILSEDGQTVTLDLRKFHDLEPAS
jgi:inward rectifier potassium channel